MFRNVSARELYGDRPPKLLTRNNSDAGPAGGCQYFSQGDTEMSQNYLKDGASRFMNSQRTDSVYGSQRPSTQGSGDTRLTSSSGVSSFKQRLVDAEFRDTTDKLEKACGDINTQLQEVLAGLQLIFQNLERSASESKETNSAQLGDDIQEKLVDIAKQLGTLTKSLKEEEPGYMRKTLDAVLNTLKKNQAAVAELSGPLDGVHLNCIHIVENMLPVLSNAVRDMSTTVANVQEKISQDIAELAELVGTSDKKQVASGPTITDLYQVQHSITASVNSSVLTTANVLGRFVTDSMDNNLTQMRDLLSVHATEMRQLLSRELLAVKPSTVNMAIQTDEVTVVKSCDFNELLRNISRAFDHCSTQVNPYRPIFNTSLPTPIPRGALSPPVHCSTPAQTSRPHIAPVKPFCTTPSPNVKERARLVPTSCSREKKSWVKRRNASSTSLHTHTTTNVLPPHIAHQLEARNYSRVIPSRGNVGVLKRSASSICCPTLETPANKTFMVNDTVGPITRRRATLSNTTILEKTIDMTAAPDSPFISQSKDEFDFEFED